MNEAARLDALAALAVEEGAPDRELDEIAGWVRSMTGADFAIVCLVEAERQVFAGRAGIDRPGSPRDLSICAHVVAREAQLVIEDARLDPVFSDHPVVTGEPHLRSYVGAPIRLSNRMVVGTLGALGTVARPAPPPGVLVRIADLADQVAFILEERAARRGGIDAMARATARAQSDFLALVNHELRTPLAATAALADMVKPPRLGRDVAPALRVSGTLMARLVEGVTSFTQIRSGNLVPREAVVPATRILEAVRTSIAARLSPRVAPRVRAPRDLMLRGDPALLTLALDCLAADMLSRGGGARSLTASVDRGGGATLRIAADRSLGAPGERIGLTLARRLIELHAGELCCRGASSTWALRLPRWRVVGRASA